MHFKDIDPKVKAGPSPTAPVSTTPAARASSAISRRRRRFPAPCGRSCSTPVSTAGARWSRIATRLLDPDPLGDATGPTAPISIHRLSSEDLTMAKLNWGMIGGGEGSQIGPAHRLGAGSTGFRPSSPARSITAPSGPRLWPAAGPSRRPRLWRLARDAGGREGTAPTGRSGDRGHAQRHAFRDHQGVS
jgi:hypothetical protein